MSQAIINHFSAPFSPDGTVSFGQLYACLVLPAVVLVRFFILRLKEKKASA